MNKIFIIMRMSINYNKCRKYVKNYKINWIFKKIKNKIIYSKLKKNKNKSINFNRKQKKNKILIKHMIKYNQNKYNQQYKKTIMKINKNIYRNLSNN